VLVGPPALDDILDLPDMRHIAQRIRQRCHLTTLSADETRLYVCHRLAVAGAPRLGPFTDAALARIAEYSEGIPRVINLVCDLCLVSGYADRKRRLDAGAVDAAIAYLEDSARPATSVARLARPARSMAIWAARGGIAVLVMMLVGLLAFAVSAMNLRVAIAP
jgi:general secretion pathway protein A